MVEECKNDLCVQVKALSVLTSILAKHNFFDQMFLRGVENAENSSPGPILLKLVETSSKKTAFYGN